MTGGRAADSEVATTDRRTANAAETRRAIVAAARRLFAERGYGAVRIEQVASLARVSPATVYAQCGGKSGLLRTLIEQWSADRALEQAARVAESQQTPEEMLETIGASAAQTAARWGDVVPVLDLAASQDAEVAGLLAREQRWRRVALVAFAGRLRETGRVLGADGDDVVVDKILFHLREQQFLLLVHQFGWEASVAEAWIVARLQAALLRPIGSP